VQHELLQRPWLPEPRRQHPEIEATFNLQGSQRAQRDMIPQLLEPFQIRERELLERPEPHEAQRQPSDLFVLRTNMHSTDIQGLQTRELPYLFGHRL